MKNQFRLAAALWVLTLFPMFAWSSPSTTTLKLNLPVERYRLPNGLTVLLYVDRGAPLITYHTWFKVGSRDEQPGTTGIAHLFEHLMFKGAKRHGPKAFDKVMQANGGTNNAFTSHDYTGYFETLPADKLEIAMDLESDRMENLQLTEENLKSEREVVKEERRYRVENDVTGRLFEETYSTVFKVHPYRWPVIGWMDDLARITVEECQKFYKTYYAPNNAVIVLAGDFNKAEAKKLLVKYYGHIPSQEIPPRIVPAEPKQTEARENIFEREVQSDYLSLAFPNAPAGAPDYYALDVLQLILGEGSSSRLYKRLVYEAQIASWVGVSNSGSKDPGLFSVIAALKPGASQKKLERMIFDELNRARTQLYSEGEIQKAKNKIMTANVGTLKTLYGKAQALAFNEVVMGSYEFLHKDLERYNKVTAQQIQKAAKTFLGDQQRNLIVQKVKAKQ
ncbi:MAG: pitrilysin family protein [Bdellovibrionia bacterium]